MIDGDLNTLPRCLPSYLPGSRGGNVIRFRSTLASEAVLRPSPANATTQTPLPLFADSRERQGRQPCVGPDIGRTGS